MNHSLYLLFLQTERNGVASLAVDQVNLVVLVILINLLLENRFSQKCGCGGLAIIYQRKGQIRVMRALVFININYH